MEDDKDLLDILFDSNNKDNIVLEDGDGNVVEFEQVAIIPYEKDGVLNFFAVLHPVKGMEDCVGENECIVFRISEDDDGETMLKIEEDNEVERAVYDKYIALLDKN